MSRTNRSIPNWAKSDSWVKKNTSDVDRARYHNGYDHKPSSPLYENFIKERGWARDCLASPKLRQERKRSASKYSRRAANQEISNFF